MRLSKIQFYWAEIHYPDNNVNMILEIIDAFKLTTKLSLYRDSYHGAGHSKFIFVRCPVPIFC